MDGATDGMMAEIAEGLTVGERASCSSGERALGALRYVSRHRETLTALPTHNINVDGVYDERFLTVITRELTTGAVHDPTLVQQTAAAMDQPMKAAVIPFGGHRRHRVCPGWHLLGLPAVPGRGPAGTQLLDTLDRVRPESVAVMRRLVMDMVAALDRSSG